MKHCPKCKREYEDDSLRFCLEDGTALVTRDTSRASAEPTAVLPGNEPARSTISQVARPGVPLPGQATDRQKPAVEHTESTTSSGVTTRIVIAVMGVIALVFVFAGFAAWGYIAVRRVPLTLLFLVFLIVAFVRAKRHPKASLLVAIALAFDLIETFIYITLNRNLSGLQTSWALTDNQVQTFSSFLTVMDDLVLATVLILLTMAVLAGRKSNLQTAWR